MAAELYQGALNGTGLKAIEAGIARFVLLPIEPAIGTTMLLLMRQFTLSHRLSFPDALIAATALHHGLPLFTLNRKDFRYIPGSQLHEPA
ncbi:MAG: PIN domain-containing protein [Bacteroidota bacterium]|nr:PIN domain-containing protein [Bacteroidota bacterium]